MRSDVDPRGAREAVAGESHDGGLHGPAALPLAARRRRVPHLHRVDVSRAACLEARTSRSTVVSRKSLYCRLQGEAVVCVRALPPLPHPAGGAQATVVADAPHQRRPQSVLAELGVFSPGGESCCPHSCSWGLPVSFGVLKGLFLRFYHAFCVRVL